MSSRRRKSKKPTNSRIKAEEATINTAWNHLGSIPGGDIEKILKEVKHHKTFMQYRWLIAWLQQSIFMLRGELERLITEENTGVSTTDYFPLEVPHEELEPEEVSEVDLETSEVTE